MIAHGVNVLVASVFYGHWKTLLLRHNAGAPSLSLSNGLASSLGLRASLRRSLVTAKVVLASLVASFCSPLVLVVMKSSRRDTGGRRMRRLARASRAEDGIAGRAHFHHLPVCVWSRVTSLRRFSSMMKEPRGHLTSNAFFAARGAIRLHQAVEHIAVNVSVSD